MSDIIYFILAVPEDLTHSNTGIRPIPDHGSKKCSPSSLH